MARKPFAPDEVYPLYNPLWNPAETIDVERPGTGYGTTTPIDIAGVGRNQSINGLTEFGGNKPVTQPDPDWHNATGAPLSEIERENA